MRTNHNIFKQAKQLLDNSNGRQLSDEEWEVLGAAMIPLNHPAYPFPQDMTVGEGLEMLANMVEEIRNREIIDER